MHALRQPERGEKAFRARATLGGRQACIDRRNFDILFGGGRGQKVVTLKDEAKGFTPQPCQRIGIHGGDIAARETSGLSPTRPLRCQGTETF